MKIIKARLHHRETVSGLVGKKWQVTSIFSKEIPEFLQGHRRLYSKELAV